MACTPNLSASFTVNLLTLGAKIALDPRGLAYNVVVFALYPIPPLITTTSIIFPLEITGLSIAPVPTPESSATISGIEKYSDPKDNT